MMWTKEYTKEYNKKWKEKNKAKVKEYKKKHHKENLIYNRERRFGGNWLNALKRDKWKCRICNKSLKNIRRIVHHRDNKGYKTYGIKANNKLSNLLSLCNSCHSVLHHRKRAKRKYHNLEWLKQQLKKRSMRNIAKECEVDFSTLYYFVNRWVKYNCRKSYHDKLMEELK